ncbi:MAG TPA: deoxyribonuclease IV [Trebonia sp.]|nr:deoxyribonuclease IV [Trebonia sp.]
MRGPLIGSHATVTGGLATGGLAYAAHTGAEVIQVFVSNPRGWAQSAGDPAQDARLRESGIPLFIHAPYLINLGSADPAVAQKSAQAVAFALARGAQTGARGVVVHTGSAVGWTREEALDQVGALLRPVLDALGDDGPDLLLEPMAGQGQMLCARAGDLAAYLAALRHHPKAGVCLDTCHMFAAGHDLTSAGGIEAMLAELAAAAGPERLKLVHANDSMEPLGSKKDRHESLGKGYIGLEPFCTLIAHPALAGVPFVVETPGGKDGHARDIALLREIRDQALVS